MNPITPADIITALWPMLPVIALFASAIVACLITRGWREPSVRRRRLQARLADLAEAREAKRLLATVHKPTLVIGDISTGWFRDSDDRQINLLRTPGGRVPAHVGTCAARAEKLVQHLEQEPVSSEVLDEAKRLHRHLVGLHDLVRGVQQ